MRTQTDRPVQTRASQALVVQLLLVHGLYYALGAASLYSKNLFFEVVPGTVYRSGQPSMEQLAGWTDRYGIRTVINLRGTNYPQYEQEQALADRLGLRMVYIDISAYRLIRHDRLCQLLDTLVGAERPILIHCRHGMDRSGVASALAAWFVGGLPYAQAKWWSYVPPGPWKYRTAISPHHVSETFDVYEAYCRSEGLDPDDPNRFADWARHVYDHVETPSPGTTPLP